MLLWLYSLLLNLLQLLPVYLHCYWSPYLTFPWVALFFLGESFAFLSEGIFTLKTLHLKKKFKLGEKWRENDMSTRILILSTYLYQLLIFCLDFMLFASLFLHPYMHTHRCTHSHIYILALFCCYQTVWEKIADIVLSNPGAGKLFSVEEQIVNILDSVGHAVSVTTTQLGHHGTKAATDNMWTQEWDCGPTRFSNNACHWPASFLIKP